MRLAFCTAHPFPPQISGGAQSSMIELAQSLKKRGHEVSILCGLTKSGIVGFRSRLLIKFMKSEIARDNYAGIDIFRSWTSQDVVQEFARLFRPHVAVCFSGLPVKISQAFRINDIPTSIYFRNVELDDFGGDPRMSANSFIANSEFTASRLYNLYKLKCRIVRPLFDRSKYEVISSGDFVTFINPHPLKGLDIACALVRECPDIPFLFVKSWTLDRETESMLQTLANQSGNLKILEATSDMRQIYGQTKIVLAPSRWDEAWGRIATEAHFSGIPVIASDIGGLPESVGPGGMLVPQDASVDDWKHRLIELWHDPIKYEQLSDAARLYAQRDEINSDLQISCLESIFEDTVRSFNN